MLQVIIINQSLFIFIAIFSKPYRNIQSYMVLSLDINKISLINPLQLEKHNDSSTRTCNSQTCTPSTGKMPLYKGSQISPSPFLNPFERDFLYVQLCLCCSYISVRDPLHTTMTYRKPLTCYLTCYYVWIFFFFCCVFLLLL